MGDRKRTKRAVAAGVPATLLLAFANPMPAVALRQPDYPSWDEVEQARSNEAAAAAKIEQIEGILIRLEAEAAELNRVALELGDDPAAGHDGRPVRDPALLAATLEAYRPMLARDRFPLVVLAVALRAADVPGTTAQLRTQLRIVYDAIRDIADKPLGTVVPTDFIFEQLQPDLLRTGILLREIDETIRKFDDGSHDGKVAKRRH